MGDNGMSAGAVAAVSVIGTVIFLALVLMIVLIIRASRSHKRLLLDLERRGFMLGQPFPAEERPSGVKRPQRALRRSSFFVYRPTTRWGALSSREDVGRQPPVENTDANDQGPDQKGEPRGECQSEIQSKQLNSLWPFNRISRIPQSILLEKLKKSRHSSAGQDPRPLPQSPIPLDPVTRSAAQSSEGLLKDQQRAVHSRMGSVTTLNDTAEEITQNRDSELVKKQSHMPSKSDCNRRTRANTIASVVGPIPPTSRIPRPDLPSRPFSLCSQHPGLAPNAPVPPLPLSIPNKTSGKSAAAFGRSPSGQSVSSLESVGSSILVSAAGSPARPRSPEARLKTGANPEWETSLILGPRPIRDTLTLRGRSNIYPAQSSARNSGTRFSLDGAHGNELSRSSRVNSTLSSLRFQPSNVRKHSAGSGSKPSRPASVSVPNSTKSSPRRYPRSRVTGSSSPARRRGSPSTVLRDTSGNQATPTRQGSQTSSQSSNGSPFKWDYLPLQSGGGKPSALKGSPGARKGHKRQNCVRISLAPTVMGAGSTGSRPPSNCMDGILEGPHAGTSAQETTTTTTGPTSPPNGGPFSGYVSLPPPSSAVFQPDLRLAPPPPPPSSCPRAPLTPNPRPLSPAAFDPDGLASPREPASRAPSPSSSPSSSPVRTKRHRHHRHHRRRRRRTSSPSPSLFSIPTFATLTPTSTRAAGSSSLPGGASSLTPTPLAPGLALAVVGPSSDKENTPPAGLADADARRGAAGVEDTPGSLYDGEGFLRV
ncbi:hypothetical protein BDY21DRAFT_365407 [Lineolata rhizophorae]|uniref:Uncharacterized protein n=1 Tax=Lineolata rhizophorae TaxID=578093 RepID=A0A6A6NW27_9PEZI|nr:hypothetical protein BDY21DRAFT_365407 [Lineolata rhizophorae]